MDANSAYIELTVTENLHPGRPADGIYQENCPTFTAIRAAVSDQCCRIETRVLEPRDATARAASHTAIVDKRSLAAGTLMSSVNPPCAPLTVPPLLTKVP